MKKSENGYKITASAINDVEIKGDVQRFLSKHASYVETSGKLKGLYTLEKKFSFEKVYAKAANGVRLATEQEVENVGRHLFVKEEYGEGCSDFDYKVLCWVLYFKSGYASYLTKLGLSYDYDKDKGRVSTCLGDLVAKFLMSDGNQDFFKKANKDSYSFAKKLTATRRMIKSNKGYLLGIAKDEFLEPLEFKVVLYLLDKYIFETVDDEYVQEKKLIYKWRKSGGEYDLSFAEKILLRRAYIKLEKYIQGRISNAKGSEYDEAKGKQVADKEIIVGGEKMLISELKSICDLLEKERGIFVDEDHFVYQVVSTIKGGGYRKCSVKQVAILRDVVEKIEKEYEKKNIAKQSNSSEFDIESIHSQIEGLVAGGCDMGFSNKLFSGVISQKSDDYFLGSDEVVVKGMDISLPMEGDDYHEIRESELEEMSRYFTSDDSFAMVADFEEQGDTGDCEASKALDEFRFSSIQGDEEATGKVYGSYDELLDAMASEYGGY